MSTPPLSLTYRYKAAEIQDGPAPVIFLFHGYGSDEADLFAFAPELPPNFTVISARAPHATPPFGYAWYALNFNAPQGKWSDLDQARESRDLIVRFIDEALVAFDLDADRVTLLGFSQGAVLSYALALSFPEKIRNLIALSGYLDPGILIDGFQKKEISNLQVYVSHGQVDQVIPASLAHATSEQLHAWGVNHVFEEYPVGHGVSPQNFYSLKKWLETRP